MFYGSPVIRPAFGRRALLILIAAVIAGCTASHPKGSIPIRFGTHTLWAEVADEEPERQQGLMFRREMGADDGMIFVFDAPHVASFWMRNTPLPLSIAFLDENRKVLNIRQMAPHDDRHYHYSDGPALYAVEAHQGWFEKRGIKAGDLAEFTLPEK